MRKYFDPWPESCTTSLIRWLLKTPRHHRFFNQQSFKLYIKYEQICNDYNLEIYFYKDGGSAAIEFTPQVLKIYIASAENLKFTSQVQKIYRTSEASAVNFLARVM